MLAIVSEATTYITTGITVVSFVVTMVAVIYNQGKKSAHLETTLKLHNAEMKAAHATSKADLVAKVDGSEARLNNSIQATRAEMNHGLNRVDTRITELTGEVQLVKQSATQSLNEGKARMDRHSRSIDELRESSKRTEIQISSLKSSS